MRGGVETLKGVSSAQGSRYFAQGLGKVQMYVVLHSYPYLHKEVAFWDRTPYLADSM